MKTSEIKELNSTEIQERMDAEQARLVRMKLNHAISPLDNPMQIKEARKNIARLATEIRQRKNN